MNNSVIIVNTKTGVDEWTPETWDDYSYEGEVFVIKRNGDWVGIYNMDNVLSVIVEEDTEGFYD